MTKRGSPLPDSNHVMRLVPNTKLMRDGDGNVVGFLAAAFELRAGELSLSLSWLEHNGSDHAANAAASKAQLLAVREKARNVAFGVAEVARTKMVSRHNSKRVRLIFAPTQGIPSHSALHVDMPVPHTVREALANEFFKERY